MGKRSTNGQPGRFADPAAAAVFQSYPPAIAKRLLVVRELIFETASATPGVGAIEETLKWGEPAYLTAQTRSGSTVRIGWKKSAPSRYAIYFHCQTDLVERFREAFPSEFKFEGNRALVLEEGDPPPLEALSVCLAEALTYHLRKRAGGHR